MSIALSLTRLDSDRLPEVELDTWSGGNHCCWGSVIYDGRGFQRTVRDWSIGGGLEDVDRDGIGELVTSVAIPLRDDEPTRVLKLQVASRSR